MLVPDGSKRDTPLPLVIYLPGWGGSSEDVIAQGGGWLARTVDKMAGSGLALRIAVVDGRSHYGGSQFLNSGATGEYADYVADEVAPAVEGRRISTHHRRALERRIRRAHARDFTTRAVRRSRRALAGQRL
jgi:hypothetical protein